LLPMVYWAYQVAHTRWRRRQAKRPQAWQAVRAALARHAITQRLAPQVLTEWHTGATDRIKPFHRASSAVEGRNGYLSPMQHNHRGLPKRRAKVWTVLHHFACRAADGTTQRLGCLGGRFRTSSKRCYPTARPCLGLDNARTGERYVTDIMECPALSGYPPAVPCRLGGHTQRTLMSLPQLGRF